MSWAPTVIGFLLIIGVNTVVAAVAIRFFRLRLSTTWGAALYTAMFVPLIFVATTLVLSGVVGFGGGGVQDRATALVLVWVLPLTLAVTLDVFWLPAPEEIETPERT